MRSPAAAIMWQIVRPYRAILAVCAAIWLVLAVLSRLLPLNFAEPAIQIFVITLPAVFILISLLYVFSLSTVTTMSTREGSFPRRLFMLPLSTPALAAWPMFLGSVALGAAWLAWAVGVLWPCGARAPLVWPALGLATFLAWLQFLSWVPFPSVSLRAPAAGLLLGCLSCAALLVIVLEVPGWILGLTAAILLAGGYGAALGAVRMARRGDGVEWSWLDRLARQLGRLRLGLRRRHPFSSALAAQAWLDWRRSGLSFPIFTGLIVLILVLSGSWIELLLGEKATQNPPLADILGQVSPGGLVLGLFLCVPLPLAIVMGNDLGIMRTSPQASLYGMSTFLALRPLSCAELIAAKLRMAVRGTLWSWALTLGGAGCWLLVSGGVQTLLAAPLLNSYPLWKIAGIGVLLVAGLMAVTWVNLVAGLWIGLTGRAWVTLAVAAAAGIVWIPVGLAGWWVGVHPDYLPGVLNLLPWLGAGVVVVKLALASCLARAVRRRRLLAPRTLLAWGAGWVMAVVGLFLLEEGFLPEGLLPRYAKVTIAILVVPLCRFAAMPLALHWNRHR
jgi:hypothetical protein